MVKRKVRNNSGMEDHIVSLSSHAPVSGNSSELAIGRRTIYKV